MLNKILDTIQKNNLVKALLVVLIAYLVIMYVVPMMSKSEGLENTELPKEPEAEKPQEEVPMPSLALAEKAPEVAPAPQEKAQLQAADLLPQYDEANDFAKQNPVSELLKEQNFLISGYHVGVNTVMQSNKIPYHDIRSAPPIPKETVGPFLQSSYEVPAGTGRRMLEIGA